MNEDSADAPVLEVRRLSKTFPGQRALDDVSLWVDRAEVHGLVGHNGSGKSTLIKILAGYHHPDPGGQVLVDGMELSHATPRESRRVGLRFMHQHLGVIDELSVVENVALVSGYDRGRSRIIKWDRQRHLARRLLAQLGVELDVDQLAGRCAPVERTAIAIARALDDEEGHPIKVLVLDEPTAALPPPEVERLFSVVERVRRAGISVIYVSHRLDEIESLADRVSILRDGRLQGTFEMAKLDKSALVELMVGERVEKSAPVRSTGRRPSAGDVVLEVEGLVGGEAHNATFTVGAGEVLGLAGLAGAGGEDVVRGLVGAIPARAERLAVHGRMVERLTPREAMAAGLVLVPANRQHGSAVAEFVVRENVTLPSLPRYRARGRLSPALERRDVAQWIDRLEVQPAEPEHAFAHLSGGNQQKVSLGKWLNTLPEALAFIDPTAGVDIKAREAIYGMIRAIAGEGRAIVVSSIDVEDLVALCDRVLVFRDGRIVDELAGDSITENALLHAVLRDFGVRELNEVQREDRSLVGEDG